MKHSVHLGLLILRVAVCAALLTHGYDKFLKVIQGDFGFMDPIGIGATLSLILSMLAEFIVPLLIIIGWKVRLLSLFPIINFLVAFFVAHSSDSFSSKEKALLFLIVFVSLYFTGGGKYAIDKS